MKAFITSQFSYCSVAWMLYSKRLGKKINALHERALRITYGYKTSSFNKLLQKDNSLSIHHKILQVLAVERYKISNNMSPANNNDSFAPKATPHNLPNPVSFKMQKFHSVYHGTETLTHLGPKIWSLVLHEIRQSVSLGDFK